MAWIKRNLYFLIGGLVALAFMGMAGWYLYSKWELNNQNFEKLNEQYEALKKLNQQNPHPGQGDIDNIKAAQEQQQQVKAYLKKAEKNFQKIPRIPDLPKITDRDFSGAVSHTIDQMQRDATNSSVVLPSSYSFSFTAQRSRMTFPPGSLDLLATQLGEVKAICDVLFQAKVNALQNIRRCRVSEEDNAGSQTDYSIDKSTTNDLSVLTPYEVNFRSFSQELGDVLAGFASSPYGFIVKSVNVRGAGATGAFADETGANPNNPNPAPATVYIPPPVAVTPRAETEASAAQQMAKRYGLTSNRFQPPAVQPAPTVAATVPAVSRALPTVLDERQLDVTLVVDVVKLLPVK